MMVTSKLPRNRGRAEAHRWAGTENDHSVGWQQGADEWQGKPGDAPA